MKKEAKRTFQINTWRLPAPVSAVIALVADLHNGDPAALLAALGEIRPDLIAIAGDLMERRDGAEAGGGGAYGPWARAALGAAGALAAVAGLFAERHQDNENAYAFLRGAARLAPVYYALGNHELSFQAEDRGRVAETGAVLLENRFVATHGLLLAGVPSRPRASFLRAFAAQPGYKVLLCHHPEYYEPLLRPLDIQLVLSGHAHGGQIRLGGQGLFAPGQGFFPRYTAGLYEGRLLVSRGLRNNTCLPRVHNPLELVVLRLG